MSLLDSCGLCAVRSSSTTVRQKISSAGAQDASFVHLSSADQSCSLGLEILAVSPWCVCFMVDSSGIDNTT